MRMQCEQSELSKSQDIETTTLPLDDIFGVIFKINHVRRNSWLLGHAFVDQFGEEMRLHERAVDVNSSTLSLVATIAKANQ